VGGNWVGDDPWLGSQPNCVFWALSVFFRGKEKPSPQKERLKEGRRFRPAEITLGEGSRPRAKSPQVDGSTKKPNPAATRDGVGVRKGEDKDISYWKRKRKGTIPTHPFLGNEKKKSDKGKEKTQVLNQKNIIVPRKTSPKKWPKNVGEDARHQSLKQKKGGGKIYQLQGKIMN